MKILFSPSEAKTIDSPIKTPLKTSLCFEDLFDKRLEVLKKYNLFLNHSTMEDLSKFMGLKKDKDILMYKNIDILSSPLQLAILRYTGVGYNYLDFPSLDDKPKEILLNSMIIFSNLFGPIKAGDKIPLYKIKQGECIGDFNPSKYYKQHFSNALDSHIEDDLIIDLRAGFYEKFYTPKNKRITMKFLKNGKTISHFAKAYRGLVARSLALYNPKDEKDFKDMPIPDLQIKEIQIKGKNSIYIYDIF